MQDKMRMIYKKETTVDWILPINLIEKVHKSLLKKRFFK